MTEIQGDQVIELLSQIRETLSITAGFVVAGFLGLLASRGWY